MICSVCGFYNVEGANYCRKCGNSLNNYANLRNVNTYSQSNNANSSKSNKNMIIIAITAIIIALILAGTFLLLLNDDGQANEGSEVSYNDLKVNTASFYLDGNPNTGITTTLNVGKEHAGESMRVMTTFSRDGVNMNNPSEYEQCIVDNDGNIVFTDYTPIPKYPDYCQIGIVYNGQIFKYGCDMSKHKGTQTSVPQIIS